MGAVVEKVGTGNAARVAAIVASLCILFSAVAVVSSETSPIEPTSILSSTRLYENVFAGTPLDTSASDIAPTTDGGYVAAGVTPNPIGYPVGWVVKLNASGTPQWSEEVGAPFTYPTSIEQTADGGYVLAGGTQGGSGAVCDPLSGRECAWVTKLDSTGRVNWQKVYATGDSSQQVPWEVRQTADGGYVIAGNSGTQTRYGAWIAKLDASGNVVWQNVFAGTSEYDGASFESVQPTADGGYVAAGWRADGVDSWAFQRQVVLVVKLDSAGHVVWHREYSNYDDAGNNVGSAYADSIALATDGGYLVAGSWTNQANTPGADFLLLRLDAGGDLLWQKAYDGGVGCFTGGTGNINCVRLGGVIYSARPTPDGGFLLSGIGHAVMGDQVAVMAWMGKVDASGTFLWQNTYFPLGSSAYAFYDAGVTTDGGVVAISTTTDHQTGRDNLYVVKADGDGNVTGCGDVHSGVPLVTMNPSLAATEPMLPVSTAGASSATAAGDTVPTSVKATPLCGDGPVTAPPPSGRKPKKRH